MTFAGTASRLGQRAICSIAAQHQWPLWFLEKFLDISMAFLRGKSFTDLAKHSGFEHRNLQFDLPVDGASLLRMIPEFASFDEITETLDMVKPGFGTNDAPWAWSIDLHEGVTLYGFEQVKANQIFTYVSVTECL